MRRKQIEVYLVTLGSSLFLLGILILPIRVWAAPLTPPMAPQIAPRSAYSIMQSTQLTATLTITATPSVTVTPPISDLPLSETPGVTPTLTLTSTPPHTPTAQVTPTTAPTPTATSEPVLPTTSPTSESAGLGAWLANNAVLFAGIMVGLLGLLFLGLLFVLFGRRKKRVPQRTGTRPITPLKPAAPPVAPTPACITYTDTEGKVQTCELNPEGMTIGRAADNQLVIGSTFPGGETVSQHHARILRKGEDWIVTDLNSANGIYVNERRTGRNLLQDGWRLALGAVIFTFRAGKGD